MNNEESILALLGESLHKHHSPIVINFNSFNAPIGQHNDHVDTVNFTMDKDGGFSFQHVSKSCTPTLPDVLSTEQAMALWQKAQDAGYVDEDYQPTISRTQAAVLADEIAKRLGFKEKWKVFESLWCRNNMRGDYNDALNQRKSLEFRDRLKILFAD